MNLRNPTIRLLGLWLLTATLTSGWVVFNVVVTFTPLWMDTLFGLGLVLLLTHRVDYPAQWLASQRAARIGSWLLFGIGAISGILWALLSFLNEHMYDSIYQKLIHLSFINTLIGQLKVAYEAGNEIPLSLVLQNILAQLLLALAALVVAIALRVVWINIIGFFRSTNKNPLYPQDVFNNYQAGLQILLERLGSEHPRYDDALIYEQRLRENIVQARRFGETEARRNDRAMIIVRLNELTTSVLGVTFNDLSMQGIGALDREKAWKEWEQEIRTRLLLYGEVTPEELRKIPAEYREQALRRYAKTHETTQALEDYAGYSLRLLNSVLLQQWNEAWHDAAKNLGNKPGIAERGMTAIHSLAEILSEVLGFNIKQSRDYQAARACMVEAPALRLKLPTCFPLVFVADSNPGQQTVQMLVDTIDVMRETGYFALVIPLEPPVPDIDTAAQLRQAVRQSPHVQDFIVLSQQDVLDIIIARNPTQQLAQYIVGQVDLSVVSPFVISGPVPENMFFGREAEIRLLVENAGKADFAIVGNRKIGKTSLLQRTHRRMEASGHVHPLSINCQTVRQATDFFAAFQAVIEETSPLTTAEDFAAIIRERRQRNGKPLVLLMDEVDRLLADDYAQGEPLAAVWRALAQEGVCHFVFCGSTGLARCLENPHSVFFNFPQAQPLGYLTPDIARMVLTQPLQTLGVALEDEQTIVEGVLHLTSGHPNLVQYIGRELVNAANLRRERLILNADLEQVQQSNSFTEFYLATIWGEAGPLEKLITLVAPREGFRVGDIETALAGYGITVPNNDMVDRALKLLCIYAILAKRDKTYRFIPASFYDILHRTQEVERLIANEQERLMEANA